jgi:TolA-binding protein
MTTAKRPIAREPEDLSIRMRRGDSTAEERRLLEQALEGSALLRVAHQVGRDFDHAARVRPGDDELIASASAKTLSRPVRRGRSRSALLLGIAATLAIATTAAATGFFFVRGDPREAPPEARPNGASAALHRGATPPEAQPKTHDETPPGAVAQTPSKPDQPAAPASRGHAGAEVGKKTASDLFRDANQARRAGNFELARALYAELQAKYPGTDEASVSRVSLGRLLLAAGRAREADQEFKSYLSTGRKNLEEEALLGRADALAQLGESGEERRVWEALLRSHPSSVYATRARQRLGELGATGASETR